ncbi:hypothetical protein ONA70_31605 [Micromonospora yasonensis]|nr:hypothetical protein [Micromonospora yasonensis]MCW3839989.1 hypothetical protein [Micromonospora yasonensis]MCW3844634.1 hypothetical protein [Micromonospora yasonensis]
MQPAPTTICNLDPFRAEKLTLEKIHLFDPSTGRNLTLHEGRSAGALAD